MTPLSRAYNPNAYSQYTYDPAKAKQLLGAAGWTPASNGVLQKDRLTGLPGNPSNAVDGWSIAQWQLMP